MLKKRLMINIGTALGPVTVVLLDTLFVGAETSNALVNSFRSSGATPFIAWTVALFMGHWFHPVDGLQPGFGHVGWPWNYVVFLVLTVFAGLLSFWIIDAAAVSNWFPTLMVVLGYATGAIFWPVGLTREVEAETA